MSGVMKENFNSTNLKKLFKSVYTAVWSRNLLMKSCEDPEGFAKGLEKFVGIRLMNDITAFDFVAATYVAAYLAVKNGLDENDKIKNALQAANAQKTAKLLNTLINPESNKVVRKVEITAQRQSGGFRDVFIALLTVLGEKSKTNRSYAENIYKKFETKLSRITPWIVNRKNDMQQAREDIEKAINSIFTSSVSSKISGDDESEDYTSTDSGSSDRETSDDSEDSNGDWINFGNSEDEDDKDSSVVDISSVSDDESKYSTTGATSVEKEKEETDSEVSGDANDGNDDLPDFDNDNDNDNNSAGSIPEGDSSFLGVDSSSEQGGDGPPEVREDLSSRSHTPLKAWKSTKIELNAKTKLLRFDIGFIERHTNPDVGKLGRGGFVLNQTKEGFKHQLGRTIMGELNANAEFTLDNVRSALQQWKLVTNVSSSMGSYLRTISPEDLFHLPEKYVCKECTLKQLKRKDIYEGKNDLVGVLYGRNDSENAVLLLPPTMDCTVLDLDHEPVKNFNLKGKKLVSNIVCIKKHKEFPEVYDEESNRIAFFYKDIEQYKKYSSVYSQIKPNELKSEDLDEESFDYSIESLEIPDIPDVPPDSSEDLSIGTEDEEKPWTLFDKKANLSQADCDGNPPYSKKSIYTLKCLQEYFNRQNRLKFYKVIAFRRQNSSAIDFLVVPTQFTFRKQQDDLDKKILLKTISCLKDMNEIRSAYNSDQVLNIDQKLVEIDDQKIDLQPNCAQTIKIEDYLQELTKVCLDDYYNYNKLIFDVNDALIYTLPQHSLKIRKLVDKYFSTFETCTITNGYLDNNDYFKEIDVLIDGKNLKIRVPTDCAKDPKLLVNILKQVSGCIVGGKVDPVKLIELNLKFDEYHEQHKKQENPTGKTKNEIVDDIIKKIQNTTDFRWKHDWSQFIVNCDLDNVITVGADTDNCHIFLGYANVNVDGIDYIVVLGVPDKSDLYDDPERYRKVLSCAYGTKQNDLAKIIYYDQHETFAKWLNGTSGGAHLMKCISSADDYRRYVYGD